MFPFDSSSDNTGSGVHATNAFDPLVTADTSVIIVTYNTGDSLYDCLTIVLNDSQIKEVILIDNGNPKDVRQNLRLLAQKHAQLKYEISDTNIGFGKACNLGAQQASSKHMLFLNPDALLKRGSIAEFERTIASLPSPSIVGGKIFDLDGKEQRGGRRRHLTLKNAISSFTGANFLSRIDSSFTSVHLEDTPAPSEAIPMEVVSGACLFMRRKDFLKLGGFDERYFLHVEDMDICREVALAGGEVWYTPKAGALHYGSTSKTSASKVQLAKATGIHHYFQKFSTSKAEALAASFIMPFMALALVSRIHILKFLRR